MNCRASHTLRHAVAACATLLTCGAFAQPEAPISCANPTSTLEINQCAMREYKLRDRELNEAYKALTASLKPDGAGDDTDYSAVKAQLVAAQKAWVVFRDADCGALRKYYEQGTIRTAMHVGCLIERTDQRTKELKAWRAQ